MIIKMYEMSELNSRVTYDQTRGECLVRTPVEHSGRVKHPGVRVPVGNFVVCVREAITGLARGSVINRVFISYNHDNGYIIPILILALFALWFDKVINCWCNFFMNEAKDIMQNSESLNCRCIAKKFIYLILLIFRLTCDVCQATEFSFPLSVSLPVLKLSSCCCKHKTSTNLLNV